MADIDIDPNADPDATARCPLRILGGGPRCRALVLVRDAAEHAEYHRRLDEALSAPVEAGVSVAAWPLPLEQEAWPLPLEHEPTDVERAPGL